MVTRTTKGKLMKHKYYFFGSSNSIDTDVIISIDKKDMPTKREERKKVLKSLTRENWNTNLVVIEDGKVIDCIYPKSWIDSVNNSLFDTYNNHSDKQIYPNPIKELVHRNELLAIYKTFRTILTYLARSQYRTSIKPILKGCHDFNLKIDALDNVDLKTIKDFNQPNANDSDVWKIIAFYLYQNISLLNGIEIYSKLDCIKYHPQSEVFINREKFTDGDLDILIDDINGYIKYLKDNYIFVSDDYILTDGNETICMKDEIFL
jgi:hypothetical protein